MECIFDIFLGAKNGQVSKEERAPVALIVFSFVRAAVAMVVDDCECIWQTSVVSVEPLLQVHELPSLILKSLYTAGATRCPVTS
jgi:hypothetical protein